MIFFVKTGVNGNEVIEYIATQVCTHSLTKPRHQVETNKRSASHGKADGDHKQHRTPEAFLTLIGKTLVNQYLNTIAE